MNSIVFIKSLNKIKETILQQEDLLCIAKDAYYIHSKQEELISEFLNDQNNLGRAQVIPRHYSGEAKLLFEEKSLVGVLQSVNLVISEIDLFIAELNNQDYLEQIRNQLSELLKAADKYFRSHFIIDEYHLIIALSNLHTFFLEFFTLTHFLEKNLTNPIDNEDSNLKELSLYFTTSYELDDYAKIISALSEILNTLSLLTPITDNNNIKVRKIESGTLWVELLTNPTLITLFITTIGAAAGFWYKNHSKSGVFNKNSDDLIKMINIHKNMQNAGIEPTKELEETIRNSSVRLAKSLDKIFEGQSQIKVNNDIIYLEESKKHQLTTETEIKTLTDKR